jgi:hypothetical protein
LTQHPEQDIVCAHLKEIVMVTKRGAGGGADKPAKGSWGGKREGSGRKTIDGVLLVGRYTITMDQTTVDIVEQVGEGNMALGVRRLAAMHSGISHAGAPGPTSTQTISGASRRNSMDFIKPLVTD